MSLVACLYGVKKSQLRANKPPWVLVSRLYVSPRPYAVSSCSSSPPLPTTGQPILGLPLRRGRGALRDGFGPSPGSPGINGPTVFQGNM
jgi:hypothetical protein